MAARSGLECAGAHSRPYRSHSLQSEISGLQRNTSESSQISQAFDFDDFDKDDDDDDDETSSSCSEQLEARPAATNSKRQKTSKNTAGSDKACGKNQVRSRGWICDRLWYFNETLPVEGEDVDAQIRSFFTALSSYVPITKPACSFKVHYIAAALGTDNALESGLAQGAVQSVRMRVYVQVASAIRESQMKLWKLPFLPPPQWLPLPGGIDGNPTYSDDRMGNNQGFIFQSIYGDQRIGNNGKKAKKLEERIAIFNAHSKNVGAKNRKYE